MRSFHRGGMSGDGIRLTGLVVPERSDIKTCIRLCAHASAPGGYRGYQAAGRCGHEDVEAACLCHFAMDNVNVSRAALTSCPSSGADFVFHRCKLYLGDSEQVEDRYREMQVGRWAAALWLGTRHCR